MGNYTNYVDLGAVKLSDQGTWLKLMSVGKYKHPVYGELNFTPEKLKQFADNVKARVRGIDLDIDYDHKLDPTRGNKAAGWIKDAEARPDGLYGLVEFTPTALTEIKNGEWRYFSPEFQDEWTDNQGNKHQNVLFGGGLTNRPFLKDLLPINLSELTFRNDTQPKEKEVDPKKLREQLGLPETATDAEVDKRLGEWKALSEKNTTPPNNDPLNDPELIKLSESNPVVKMLIEQNKQTMTLLKQQEGARRLAEMNAKFTQLGEGAKFALAPVHRDALQAAMLSGDAVKLSEAAWGLLEGIKKGDGIVQLGEQGYNRTGSEGGGSGGNRNSGGGQDRFEQAIVKLQEDFAKANPGKTLSYADAAIEVSKQDGGKLFNEYAEDALSFKI